MSLVNLSADRLNFLQVVVCEVFRQNFNPRPSRALMFGGGLIFVQRLKTEGVSSCWRRIFIG